MLWIGRGLVNMESELPVTYYVTMVHNLLGEEFYNATFLKFMCHMGMAHGLPNLWDQLTLN